MLVDTDVLIWNMRGNEKAAELLARYSGFRLSAVSWMELMQGARNKHEHKLLRQALRHWRAEIQPVNEAISNRASFWIEELSLSHGLRMADALIAATAWYLGQTLCTANDRHYRNIPDLELEIFRP